VSRWSPMPESSKRPAGPWSKEFNRRVADQILDCWACSAWSLEHVLDELRKTHHTHPSVTTVVTWKRNVPEFTKAYAHAREDRAHYMADSCSMMHSSSAKAEFKKSRQREEWSDRRFTRIAVVTDQKLGD
jgi:hypothetical protein